MTSLVVPALSRYSFQLLEWNKVLHGLKTALQSLFNILKKGDSREYQWHVPFLIFATLFGAISEIR